MTKKKCKDRRRFNSGRFPKKEFDLCLLRDLCKEETPIKDLMRTFNCSKPTIQRNIKKHIHKKYWRKNWGRDPNNPVNRKIVKLYTNHYLTTAEVGIKLGLSDEKVRQRLIRLGIERRRKDYKDFNRFHPATYSNNPINYSHADAKLLNKQISEMYLKTGSMLDVASELKIDRDTVRRRLNFMNIPRIKIDRNQERNQQIKKMYEETASSYAIADRFKLSCSAIIRILRNLGVAIRKRGKRALKDYSTDKLFCEKLQAMYLWERKNITEISKETKLSWTKIKKHLVASGVKVKRFYNYDSDKNKGFNNLVRKMYVEDKMKGGVIAKKLDCCLPKVYKRLRHLGIKLRNSTQYFTEEEIKRYKRIVYWYNRGLKIASISRMEKLSKSTIYYVLKRNKVKMRRTIETQSRRDIVKMALRNPIKYRNYADMKIMEKEKKYLQFYKRRSSLKDYATESTAVPFFEA